MCLVWMQRAENRNVAGPETDNLASYRPQSPHGFSGTDEAVLRQFDALNVGFDQFWINYSALIMI